MLLVINKPTFVQVEIFGENLFNNQKSILRRIGSIVEVPGFYENLTARENLLINAKILGVHKKNTIEEALEIVDLHNETKKLVGKYSLRSEEHTSELQSRGHLVCRLLLEKKKKEKRTAKKLKKMKTK